MIGFETLDVGEVALVYSLEGAARIEVGPARLFLWREKFQRLDLYTANQNEYLVIEYRNGKIEHQPGPCTVYLNPLEHQNIHSEPGEKLDANEVLVVYRRDDMVDTTEKGKRESTPPNVTSVKRYIVHGPTVFKRAASEWFHTFKWHGTDPQNKTRMIPNGNTFRKLQVIPDQFYYNVDEVRTADDALIRVKLMMFYELQDIELMLSATQDPFADFVNCLCADVVAWCAKRTYMEFIETSGALNDLEHYPQLRSRCKSIGYGVSKVVFRGYYASPKLQQMHDHAIEARTKLKLEYEQAEQEQALTDQNLHAEMKRIQQEQRMELERLKYNQESKLRDLTHQLQLKCDKAKDDIERSKQNEMAKLQAKKDEDELSFSHMQNLSYVGVDVSKYLLSQIARPQKVIQVVAAKDAAILHLHHN